MGIESIPEWEDNWIPPSSNEERDYVTTSAREVVQVQTETEIETEIEIENTKGLNKNIFNNNNNNFNNINSINNLNFIIQSFI